MDFLDYDEKQTEYDMDSFLLVGQSNMAGRGELSEYVPPEEHDCWMLRMGRWQEMAEPVNVDRTFNSYSVSGVGPASTFAYEYYKETRRKTGLIPCADGATNVEQWMPGTVLFDHALFQTELATRSSELKAILWHQGENDALPGNTDKYFDRLFYLMKAFRAELGDVPIIMGEISEKIDSERYNHSLSNIRKINSTIHEVAEQLPCCAVASSAGLSLKSDGIHFTTASQAELGRRYYQQYRILAGLK